MTDISAAALGAMIRDARKQRHLTQTELALRLGTSQSAVTRLESGNQNVSLEMINRVAAALESPLLSTANTTQNLRYIKSCNS